MITIGDIKIGESEREERVYERERESVIMVISIMITNTMLIKIIFNGSRNNRGERKRLKFYEEYEGEVRDRIESEEDAFTNMEHWLNRGMSFQVCKYLRCQEYARVCRSQKLVKRKIIVCLNFITHTSYSFFICG